MQHNELDVGYVAGVHGVNGVVRIKLHDPTSVALRVGSSLVFEREGRAVATHAVEAADLMPGKPGLYRVRLQGVGFRDVADALRGCAVIVTRQALPALEAGEFYLADAIGLRVERDAEPCLLGTIVGLTSNGVQDLFEVQWRDSDQTKHDWLLPILPGIVLDVDARRVHVALPAGFVPEALEPSI